LKDIAVHFFASVCKPQTNGTIMQLRKERADCEKLGTYYKQEIKYVNETSMRAKSSCEDVIT